MTAASGAMLSPAEAEIAIVTRAPRLPVVSAALRDAAGAVLQQSVVAERDQPPFDRVSMDGIAVRSSTKVREFRIAGTQAAGAVPLTLTDDAECFEAMTGAILPIGCDCVVPVERLRIDAGIARLTDDVVLAPWQNIHRRGVDCKQGDSVLRAGTHLAAPELAVLASAGLAHAQVVRKPRIVVISTGDELVEPGAAIADWQIRRSNVYAVVAALKNRGFLRVADDHIADDEAELRRRLERHLIEADVLILSGGVSMGKFDFVPKVLTELGVEKIFHKIAQRPGKPMWFGVRGDGKAVYALPGNPVSTLVCLARYVVPGLFAAMGRSAESPLSLPLAQPCKVLEDLTTLLPVKLDGAPSVVHPRPTQGSGDFTSLIGTDGFVELPPGSQPLGPGTAVRFYRW